MFARGAHPPSIQQSGRRGSNPRHQAWKACALPAELLPQVTTRSPPGILSAPPVAQVVGEGFEPSKAYAGRFTVCSRWPLGYPTFAVPPTPSSSRTRHRTSTNRADGESRTRNRLITNQVLCQLSYVSDWPFFARLVEYSRSWRVSSRCNCWRYGDSAARQRTFFQRAPWGVSSTTIPFSSKDLRIPSAAAKSLRPRAAFRAASC